MLICRDAERVHGQRKVGNVWFRTKSVTIKLASHESCKAKQAPITERPASSNVVMSQQPQQVALHENNFFRRKHRFLRFSLASARFKHF